MENTIICSIKKAISDKRGQALTEYMLILMLISIVAVTLLTEMGSHLITKFNEVSADLGGLS